MDRAALWGHKPHLKLAGQQQAIHSPGDQGKLDSTGQQFENRGPKGVPADAV